MKRGLLFVCLVSTVACTSEEGAPPRVVEASLAIGADGLSEPLSFAVPPGTRSVSIVASGATESLVGLASFVTADGTEQVAIPLDGSHAAAMQAQYVDEEIGQMPGDLFQVIRLGTYAHVYPYAPGQSLVEGTAELRVASTATNGQVDVMIRMPEDDGASTLHVNVIAVSNTVVLGDPVSFLDDSRALLAGAGIDLVVDEVVTVTDSGLNRITDFSEPQEAPGSMSAQLALLGRSLVASDALNVFLVDELPFGVGGLSLGTPGPADPDSYYWGVLARYVSDDPVLARVLVHELAHFLALHHVENRGISGMIYPDPLDDTAPGTGNLMDDGTAISAGQAFALSRSALLALE
jgi:hypothetical protein